MLNQRLTSLSRLAGGRHLRRNRQRVPLLADSNAERIRIPASASVHTYSTLATTHYTRQRISLDPSFSSSSSCRQTQVRWKRHDGNKASTKSYQRPPTKKQRKAYNRKIQEKYGDASFDMAANSNKTNQRTGQHGAPGSRAGPRREFYQALQQDWQKEATALVSQQQDGASEDDDYSLDDALLDDLMGNTKSLTAQPTPQPKYLGHQFAKHRNQIVQQMQAYRQERARLEQQQQQQGDKGGDSDDKHHHLVFNLLPSDRSIARAMASFRDKHGTRQRPVGLARALEYVLQDLQIPLSALGEHCYTTLLTSCRTPAEGRRVMQLMQTEQQLVASSYNWSALVDLYAKVGDPEGCRSVLTEMLQHNVPPGLAAYTSSLAACHKVVRDGRVPHSVRAKAAQTSWELWQEMRVVGVDPDVMAYGAMLRLCAAQGQAERALNLLEEMQQFEVKPTSLCFSSALRAVAKSQAIAIRFENGSSKRNRRREFLASHHGKMAQSIVRLAEQAQVEQDTSFVSALILCAANVGDVATAKAIYVASELRKLDQFRSIGSNQHLAQLRGDATSHEQEQLLLSRHGGSSENALATIGASDMTIVSGRKSFEEREYGKDSRVLSAIMLACANAVDQNGIGTLWQGRENRGYLCEDSVRLLTAQKMPRYVDNTIPFQSTTDDLTWDGEYRDEDDRKDKYSKRPFNGVEELDGGSLDELDDVFAKIYLDDEGELKKEFRKTTPEDIWRMKYKDPESQELLEAVAGRSIGSGHVAAGEKTAMPSPKVDMYFDYDTMRWKHSDIDAPEITETKQVNKTIIENETMQEDEDELYFDYDTMKWQTRSKASSVAATGQPLQSALDSSMNAQGIGHGTEIESKEELYFDTDTMRWKSRPVEEATDTEMRTAFEAKVLQSHNSPVDTEADSEPVFDEAGFANFYADLRAEILESGEDVGEVDEEEARELFALVQDEYEEVMNMDIDKLVELGLVDSADVTQSEVIDNPQLDDEEEEADSDDFDSVLNDIREELVKESSAGFDDDESTIGLNGSQSVSLSAAQKMMSTSDSTSEQISALAVSRDMAVFDDRINNTYSLDPLDELHTTELDELRAVLPTFSDRRISKILTAFKQNLDDPPLLDLVPLVRETMPDYITATWLKQMSSLTARYVVHKAGQDGLVDIHMLNSALELETRAGSLNRAVEFYETEFTRQGLAPNEYSNRLLLQMFVGNKRLPRALAFKDELKEAGTDIDIASYGSLVEYCARHGQVGSAVLLLKECLEVHGAAPGEASLTRLRALCRKNGFEKDLTAMVGPDPVEWLRHGEAKLKREYSKKGRRDVQIARSRLVHV